MKVSSLQSLLPSRTWVYASVVAESDVISESEDVYLDAGLLRVRRVCVRATVFIILSNLLLRLGAGRCVRVVLGAGRRKLRPAKQTYRVDSRKGTASYTDGLSIWA
jgi:hypothetical protein